MWHQMPFGFTREYVNKVKSYVDAVDLMQNLRSNTLGLHYFGRSWSLENDRHYPEFALTYLVPFQLLSSTGSLTFQALLASFLMLSIGLRDSLFDFFALLLKAYHCLDWWYASETWFFYRYESIVFSSYFEFYKSDYPFHFHLQTSNSSPNSVVFHLLVLQRINVFSLYYSLLNLWVFCNIRFLMTK